MKSTILRIFPVFVFCQILAFMPTASAGPYEELIVEIENWIRNPIQPPLPIPATPEEEEGEEALEFDPDDPDLVPSAPPDAQDLVRPTLQKVQGCLTLLSRLAGDGETPNEETDIRRAKEKVTPNDRQQCPVAGQQLGILGYMLHCLEVAQVEGFSAGKNPNVNFFLQLLDSCPWPRLLQEALMYFDTAYRIQPESVKFTKKSRGDQLGVVLEFTAGEQTYKYRIKTHSEGSSKRSHSSGTALNPYELFVYSVMELSDLGLEAHFFGYDPSNFYIATRDIGDRGTPEPIQILTYDNLKGQRKLTDPVSEWMRDKSQGFLMVTSQDPGNLTTIPLVIKALVQTNVIAHLLGLTDLNSGNTCFVFESRTGDELGKLLDYRIVDFRPIGRYYENVKSADQIFSAFKNRRSSDSKDYTNYPTDPMAMEVLGKMNEVLFLFLSRYLFPEKIFLAIDEAEERVIPVLRGLYPSGPPGEESEQIQEFRRLVQCVRWGIGNFLKQLEQKIQFKSPLISFLENEKWRLAAKPILLRIERGDAARPTSSASPMHSKLTSAETGAYGSPSSFRPKIVSPSKKIPIDAQIEIAKAPAREEIACISKLITDAKKLSQRPGMKQAIAQASGVITKAKGQMVKITSEGQIGEIVDAIQKQMGILQKAMQDSTQTTRKASAAPKPERGGLGKPPVAKGAASKSQGKPKDSEKQRKVSKPREPGASFETPDRQKQARTPGMRPSPEKPKGPPGSAEGDFPEEETDSGS